MDDESKKTAEEQVNDTEAKSEANLEVNPENTPKDKEETIGEVLNQEKKEQKTVPEAVFLELKNSNKELKKDLKRLQDLIESGASQKEVNSDLKTLAEEHNVDSDFLDKLVAIIEKKAEDKVSSKIKPLEDKERLAKINDVFEANFNKAIDRMPEFKDVVNKDVIKALSFDQANQNKTFSQIIEQAYGHLVQGKKTLERSSPAGTKDTGEVDFERAKTDPKYFSEIMAKPDLKKKYNTGLAERLKL